jgi:hypothetical protein
MKPRKLTDHSEQIHSEFVGKYNEGIHIEILSFGFTWCFGKQIELLLTYYQTTLLKLLNATHPTQFEERFSSA